MNKKLNKHTVALFTILCGLILCALYIQISFSVKQAFNPMLAKDIKPVQNGGYDWVSQSCSNQKTFP